MDSNNCAIVILAAGEARRMGRAKQLLEHNGKTLLQQSIETALATDSLVVVVLGAHKKETFPLAKEYPVKVVVNEHFKQGLSTSIIKGLSAACKLARGLAGVLIMLVDQPGITSDHLRVILDIAATRPNIIATEYHKVVGVPAYFPCDYFEQLKLLTGDSGARLLLSKYKETLETISFEDAAVDIDTDQDWNEFLQAGHRS